GRRSPASWRPVSGSSAPPVNAGPPPAADRTRTRRVQERGEPPRWTRASGRREGVARPGRSGEPELPGVVVVDRAGAGRAVPAGLQGGAAGVVAQALGVGGAGAVGAPLGEQAQ